MDVELLVVRDCPNEVPAGLALAEAARLAGIEDLRVRVTVVSTEADAQRLRFVGSPTFLIDGVDPFAVAAARVGVTCRVYQGHGGPSGVPDVRALRDALVRACISQASAAGDR